MCKNKNSPSKTSLKTVDVANSRILHSRLAADCRFPALIQKVFRYEEVFSEITAKTFQPPLLF